jgi:hypothetical protein
VALELIGVTSDIEIGRATTLITNIGAAARWCISAAAISAGLLAASSGAASAASLHQAIRTALFIDQLTAYSTVVQNPDGAVGNGHLVGTKLKNQRPRSSPGRQGRELTEQTTDRGLRRHSDVRRLPPGDAAECARTVRGLLLGGADALLISTALRAHRPYNENVAR